MDTRQRLSKVTICLHWIIAITIIGLTTLGLYMTSAEDHRLYGLHKSLGAVITFVVLVRVVWRAINGWPSPVRLYPSVEKAVAKAVHWTLLLGSVLMPLSGMVMSGFSGHGISIFGLELIARQVNFQGEVVPYHPLIASLGEVAHSLIGYVLVVAIFLHVLGALKHHLIDGDSTLTRMLGQTTQRR